MAIDTDYDDVMTLLAHVANSAAQLFTHVNGTQIILLDDYKKVIEGRFATGVGANSIREAMSAAFLPYRTAMDEHLADLRKIIDTPFRPGSAEFHDAWHRYAVLNSKTVQRRNITYGPLAGSGGVGNQSIARLSVDWEGEPLEDISLGSVTARCVRDQNSGTERGREAFLLRMGTGRFDYAEDGGSGIETEITAAAGDDLLTNASFQDVNVAGGTLEGWQSDVAVNATNYTQLTADYHRVSPEERQDADTPDTPVALQMNVSATISQAIRTNSINLDENVPMGLAAAFKVIDATTEGTAKLRFGSYEATVVIPAASTVQWAVLLLPLAASSWILREANQDDLNVELEWDRTNGPLAWDDVQCKALTRGPDGLWYFAYQPNAGGVTPVPCLVGGASGRWERTFSNALVGSDSEIQRFISWLYGYGVPNGSRVVGPIGTSLPSTTGVPTNPDL